jgi:hypothetical protein
MSQKNTRWASRKASPNQGNVAIEKQFTALAAEADAGGEIPFTVTFRLHVWELFGLARMARDSKTTMAEAFTNQFNQAPALDFRDALINYPNELHGH